MNLGYVFNEMLTGDSGTLLKDIKK